MNEGIIIENPIFYASIIYIFCSIKKKCEFLYPFLVIPLITDGRCIDIIRSHRKNEIFYLASKIKENHGELFFVDYNEIILGKKEYILEALLLCLKSGFMELNYENNNLYIVSKEKKKYKSIEIENNIFYKNAKRLANICNKTTLSSFLIAMKVRI